MWRGLTGNTTKRLIDSGREGERGQMSSPFSHLGVSLLSGGEVGLTSSNSSGVQSVLVGGGTAVWGHGRQLRWDFSLLASRSVSWLSLLYTARSLSAL